MRNQKNLRKDINQYAFFRLIEGKGKGFFVLVSDGEDEKLLRIFPWRRGWFITDEEENEVTRCFSLKEMAPSELFEEKGFIIKEIEL